VIGRKMDDKGKERNPSVIFKNRREEMILMISLSPVQPIVLPTMDWNFSQLGVNSSS